MIVLTILVSIVILSLNFVQATSNIVCNPCFGYFQLVSYDETNGLMRLKNGQRQAKITSLSEGTLEGGYNQLFEAGQIITITGISAGEHIFTINYYAPSALTSYSDTALLRDSSKPTQALSISCDPCFTFFQFVDYTDSLFGLLRIKNGQKQIKINSVSVGTKEGYDQIIEAGRIFSILLIAS